MYASLDYVRRIVPETSTSFQVPVLFPISGSSIDLWFINGQYFDSSVGTIAITDVLSCSRASVGYATTSAGTLTQFASDTLRITNLGLLIEDTRTNVVLWNRDLTNVAWTPTNITAALDQIGVDGSANSASSIVSTAGNGTILQSITLASSARFQSAYVKRLVGSGTINMTMDNGATWTAITVTSDWTLVSIPSQTIANPIVGFRIVTSGDKIAVDFVQNENGTFGSSSIPTTTTSAARAADQVNVIVNLDTLLSVLPHSVLIDVKTTVSTNTAAANILADDIGPEELFSVGNNFQVMSALNGVQLNAPFSSESFSGGVKVGIGLNTGARSLVGAGDTVVTDINAAALAGLIGLGCQGNVNFMYGRIRRATFWNSKLADATLRTLTAP